MQHYNQNHGHSWAVPTIVTTALEERSEKTLPFSVRPTTKLSPRTSKFIKRLRTCATRKSLAAPMKRSTTKHLCRGGALATFLSCWGTLRLHARVAHAFDPGNYFRLRGSTSILYRRPDIRTSPSLLCEKGLRDHPAWQQRGWTGMLQRSTESGPCLFFQVPQRKKLFCAADGSIVRPEHGWSGGLTMARGINIETVHTCALRCVWRKPPGHHFS